MPNERQKIPLWNDLENFLSHKQKGHNGRLIAIDNILAIISTLTSPKLNISKIPHVIPESTLIGTVSENFMQID